MRALLWILLTPTFLAAQAPGDWPAYGRDPGGTRFSPLTGITAENVSQLEVAWTYNTGDAQVRVQRGRPPALEATPLVIDGTMYLSTPTGRVIGLDAATGQQRWRYDPGVNPNRGYGDFAARGVSYWRDAAASAGTSCARRIFFATIDARLLSLDAATGRPCIEFGDSGVIDLRRGIRILPAEFPFYEVTSPPAIVGDLVITGSAIADNSCRIRRAARCVHSTRAQASCAGHSIRSHATLVTRPSQRGKTAAHCGRAAPTSGP